MRFPGQYHDAETGLHYNLHRYYDPATGRYQLPDPLGLVAAPDEHTYVLNPMTWADPLGLEGCITVYRVEGAGNERVRITDGGGALIRKTNQPIFLNFGVASRARDFLAKRLAQGFTDTQIKAFKVKPEFLDWLRANAVPESMAKDFPGAPLVVDTTKAADQFVLRPDHIKMMFEHMVPGSGHVL